MLVRGRRLDPRRILRYLFQELIAPWIHLKRLWLRIIWFFTTPIYIGPMWTTSVVSGLLGVMLTILLFKPPARLEASTSPVPVTPPPAMLLAPPPVQPTVPAPLEVAFDARLLRTTLGDGWNQHQQTTLVSTSSGLSPFPRVPPIRDAWTAAHRRPGDSLPHIYRQTAPLWNPAAVSQAVAPSDRPLSYGGAGESHPALIVTRDLPAEIPPSEPTTYALIVQNRGAELLEQIDISEQLSNLDRVESTHPPADVSANALHWRIDALRPGQERRLAVTLQPGSDREIRALAEVRTSVSVSSSIRVAASPLTVNEAPPRLLETPRLVEPASREEAPRVPRLSVIAEIPTSIHVDDELSTVFIVSNTGNGDADAVVLTVQVPSGLEHRDGVLVEHRYAHIPAGTTKRAIFKALARTPSRARIDAVLTMGGTRVADWTTQIEVTAKPVPAVVAPTTAPPGNPGSPPASGSSIPGGGSISSGSGSPPAATAPSAAPIDSSIPRNRPPVSPVTPESEQGLPGPAAPRPSIPGGPSPVPGAPPEQAAPEDSNFVSVPRRQGSGGISGWKRVMHR